MFLHDPLGVHPSFHVNKAKIERKQKGDFVKGRFWRMYQQECSFHPYVFPPFLSSTRSFVPPFPQKDREETSKGGFVKGRFWRRYPRSGFGTVIPFFVPLFQFSVLSFHLSYPRSGLGGPGEHPPKPTFGNHAFENQLSLRIFWGYFLPQKLFLLSEVIFKTPPKLPFKTSVKITSRGYFYFLRLFFASRGYFWKIASKDS